MYRGGPLSGSLVATTEPSTDPHYRDVDGSPMKLAEGDAVLSGRAPGGRPGAYALAGIGSQLDGRALLRIAVYDFRPVRHFPTPEPLPTTTPLPPAGDVLADLGL
jgi:hypothetical protein